MSQDRLTGLVLQGVGGLFWVEDAAGQVHAASARGLFRLTGLVPTAGDRVDCEPSGDVDRPWQINHIHPRKNSLLRPPVANLDGLWITVSVLEPPPDLLMVDKLITICRLNQIEPLLIWTKTDLVASVEPFMAPYRNSGLTQLQSRPDQDDTLGWLSGWLKGKRASLAGLSGSGKSTLLNRLMHDRVMSVASVSKRIGRGRHTTRSVVFFPCCGGYIADTPGFSTLSLEEAGVSAQALAQGYPELDGLEGTCRFRDCRHLGEPGCAVDRTGIHPERLARYRSLRQQLEAYEKDQWD